MARYKLAPNAVIDFDRLYEFGIDNFDLVSCGRAFKSRHGQSL